MIYREGFKGIYDIRAFDIQPHREEAAPSDWWEAIMLLVGELRFITKANSPESVMIMTETKIQQDSYVNR